MKNIMYKKISQARFRALTFSILPIAFELYEEMEWYEDEKEYFLASLIYDQTDDDWCFVIMARDEDFIFKSIEHEHSFADIESARGAMLIKLAELSDGSVQIHPQGNSYSRKKDIFELKVSEQKLHKNFVLLKDNEVYSSAKDIIKETAYSFIDCDGRFFEEFQSSGFDARIWELYLYTYLHEEFFSLNREYSSPDYLCSKGKAQVCIEATTVNPPESSNIDDETNLKNLFEYKPEYNSIKFDRALRNKLDMKYWEKIQVKGLPLIFAIQSFESLGDSTSIISYLYGVKHNWEKDKDGNLVIIPEKITKHIHENKTRKSGFFFFPDSENISAILFSNSGTISKFNRMGKLAGFGSNRVEMTRWGLCLNHDPKAVLPMHFSFEVTPETYSETWGQGLCMFHNPKAIHPVDPELFPNISHHFYENGQVNSYCRNPFNPFWSQTILSIKK